MDPQQIHDPLIFRIANEILADIFLLNQNRVIDHWDASRVADHDPRRTTRYSSQVCQRWRNVALGYSALWSRIIRYNKDPLPWIDELLRRSHPTTIELGQAHATGRLTSPELPVLSRVMCHAQRLRTVNLWVEEAAWQAICEGILPIQAPNLEYLLLSRSKGDALVFSGTLLSDNAPCLRRLHLSRCIVDLSSSTLSNLTELSLQNIIYWAPTVPVWLTILGNTPFLRWLTIIGAISSSFLIYSLPTACLPNLSCLSIMDNFQGCVTLVEHIACPPSCVLRLNCFRATLGPTLARLSSIIEEKLKLWRTPAKADRYFIFQCLGYNVIRIGNSRQLQDGCVWNVSESEGVGEVIEDPVLAIQLFFSNFEEMESSALPILLGFSPVFSTVSHLTFCLDSTTQRLSLSLLGVRLLFDNVEELDVLERSFIIFLTPFETPWQPGDSAPPTTPLPLLQTIRLENTDFRGSAFNVLVTQLQYRQRVLPIGTMEINFGHISHAQQDILKQFPGLDLKIDTCYDGSDE